VPVRASTPIGVKYFRVLLNSADNHAARRNATNERCWQKKRKEASGPSDRQRLLEGIGEIVRVRHRMFPNRPATQTDRQFAYLERGMGDQPTRFREC